MKFEFGWTLKCPIGHVHDVVPEPETEFEWIHFFYTLSELKYLHTTTLKCITCVIYWLSAKLGSKKEIVICKYIKYDVSALTWVKNF